MTEFRYRKMREESPSAPDVLEFAIPDGTQVSVSREVDREGSSIGPVYVRIYLTEAESSSVESEVRTELDAGPTTRA